MNFMLASVCFFQPDNLYKKLGTSVKNSMQLKNSCGLKKHAHGKNICMKSKKQMASKDRLNLSSVKTKEAFIVLLLSVRVLAHLKIVSPYAQHTEAREMKSSMKLQALMIANLFMWQDSLVELGALKQLLKWRKLLLLSLMLLKILSKHSNERR